MQVSKMQVTAESKFIGLGVAGNFAGHLEQAGEASDFVAVVVRDIIVPKALFPFFGLTPGRVAETARALL